jgi:hypothetical protein
LILGSDGVLERAWCLYEIAVRREAWKRSQLLFLRVGGPLAENHWQATKLPVSGLLWCIFYRTLMFVFSFNILYLFCSCLSGFQIVWKRFSTISSFALREAGGFKFDYCSNMKAFKDSDKQGIKQKIEDVFGGSEQFDDVIGSATVQADCSRLSFSLLLWMESIIFCISFPVHVASGTIGVVVGMIITISWRVCSMCNQRIYDQYVASSTSIEPTGDGHLAFFVFNWMALSVLFEVLVCSIFVGILVLIPSSAIMCSTFVYRKCCSATQPGSSSESRSAIHAASGTLVVESAETL